MWEMKEKLNNEAGRTQKMEKAENFLGLFRDFDVDSLLFGLLASPLRTRLIPVSLVSDSVAFLL